MNPHSFLLPAVSSAVRVMAQGLPAISSGASGGGVCVIVMAEGSVQLSETPASRVQSGAKRVCVPAATRRTLSSGQVMFGASRSTTFTVNVHGFIRPTWSVAVRVMVWGFSSARKRVPGGGVCVTLMSPGAVLSSNKSASSRQSATRAVHVALSASRSLFDGHEISGGVTSNIAVIVLCASIVIVSGFASVPPPGTSPAHRIKMAFAAGTG
ncbi:MAG: hypothetical protein BWX80_04157 [Candidatus Hydrogenedentes bacterium ADurb.Bin101]|nr:MAG: hypothetical protein BWX80_04157 [Candidatus Hydrogenedentes bacterium ADurb.Bin101]